MEAGVRCSDALAKPNTLLKRQQQTCLCPQLRAETTAIEV